MLALFKQRIKIDHQEIQLHQGYDPFRLYVGILFLFDKVTSEFANLTKLSLKLLLLYLLFSFIFIQLAGYIKINLNYRVMNKIVNNFRTVSYYYIFLMLFPFILLIIAFLVYIPISFVLIDKIIGYKTNHIASLVFILLAGVYAITVPIQTSINQNKNEIRYTVKTFFISGIQKKLKIKNLTSLYCYLDHGDAEGGYIPYHYLIGVDETSSKSYTLLFRFSFTHKRLKENSKDLATLLNVQYKKDERFDGEDWA